MNQLITNQSLTPHKMSSHNVAELRENTFKCPIDPPSFTFIVHKKACLDRVRQVKHLLSNQWILTKEDIFVTTDRQLIYNTHCDKFQTICSLVN